MADEYAHVQRPVSVVKMATVLEECNTEEQRSVVRSLLAKGLNVKDIHKHIFSHRITGVSDFIHRLDFNNYKKKEQNRGFEVSSF
jgi:hypothetical protein